MKFLKRKKQAVPISYRHVRYLDTFEPICGHTGELKDFVVVDFLHDGPSCPRCAARLGVPTPRNLS